MYGLLQVCILQGIPYSVSLYYRQTLGTTKQLPQKSVLYLQSGIDQDNQETSKITLFLIKCNKLFLAYTLYSLFDSKF